MLLGGFGFAAAGVQKGLNNAPITRVPITALLRVMVFDFGTGSILIG